MKKLIAILAVMIVLAGVVFATTNDKITLQTSVAEIKPAFKIYSGNVIGAAAPDAVDTQLDLSEEDIDWTFTLKQEGQANSKTYSRYEGVITLTVTINPFSSALATQSTAYTITGATKGADVANKLTNGAPSIANDKHSVAFTLTYLGKKLNDSQATNVGSLEVTWTQEPDLPMADGGTDYTADIVLTYSVE